MELTGRILVLGLGVSGAAVAEHLAALKGSKLDLGLTVMDAGDSAELRARAESLRAHGVEVRLCADRIDEAYDLVVASPGIPPHAPLMRAATEHGAEVVSEIELAYRLAHSPFAAVTGTNGKTTVTLMIGHLLQESGIPTELVGNIGTPVIEVVEQAGPATVLATEVSSFQLALTERFRPRVAVLLNITPDHLDWHGSMEAYAADKGRIFANQGEGDTAVVVVDDPGAAPFADDVERRGVRVVRVSLAGLEAGGASVIDGDLVLDGPEGVVRLLAVDDLPVRGDHNVTNALAAAAAAVSMGASPTDVASALRTFKPASHRLEPVGVFGGVEFYDDSKATNPDAVVKALTAFDDRPVIVLLGGRAKGTPFRPLAEEVAERCKAAVLFGEAADEIAPSFEGLPVDVRRAGGLDSAIDAAMALAESGDVVLLSPACASFDEFTGYAARGDAFKRRVAELGRGRES